MALAFGIVAATYLGVGLALAGGIYGILAILSRVIDGDATRDETDYWGQLALEADETLGGLYLTVGRAWFPIIMGGAVLGWPLLVALTLLRRRYGTA